MSLQYTGPRPEKPNDYTVRVRVRARHVLTCLVVSGASIGCQPKASDMFGAGGAWYVYLHQGLPEAGRR